ncbi:DUF1835 domain-containing protein [uncultured Lutibacter sp.]|uniref:DUF1835 domain-containing protein n=1 Tax=uncultured Lutibacter sp. TaxID=437739 RepID=UPI00262E796D|nr:DUF1835 domain-containing protein [uncultured Lutibacter sp.]
MDNVLHVVNGDYTAQIFKQTIIKGKVVVWRELLCEGPIEIEVGSDDFWMNRYSYIKTNFGVERLEYFDKTIKEIIQLEDLEKFDEVVLWFEYDLFCQVNLIAACSYLLQSFRKDVAYFLVCTGYEKGKNELQSLSNYMPKQYPNLLENRIKISKTNLEFANNCWKIFVENKKDNLKNYNFKHSKFRYLQKAIDQHLETFPKENGLNEIENKILELIESNSFSKNEIIRQLLLWQNAETVYGFGDLQYFNYLQKLSKYFEVKDEIYTLNELGKTKLQ